MPMPYGWRKPIEERIAKFTKRNSMGCLEWTGALSSTGYAVINVDKRQMRVTRLLWERTNGAIPAGRYMCHRCDNPKCVEISHLFAGTANQNMQDAKKKGRIARGAALPQTRLTAHQVFLIRLLDGLMDPREIEKKFDISSRYRRAVVNHEVWQHI